MKVKVVRIEDDEAFIVPLGDMHIGDKNVDYDAIQEKIDFIKNHDNARCFINGDLINLALTDSKSSTFDQDDGMDWQVNRATNLLKPIKDKIIGINTGNHDSRLEQKAGGNLAKTVCGYLGDLDLYCGYSAVVDLRLGKENKGNGRTASKVQYTLFFHHTNGGGSTAGSKINPVDKLRNFISNADVYYGNHNHFEAVMKVSHYEYNLYKNETELRDQWLVDCGGFLKHDDSYAEQKGLPPAPIGSPISWFSGKERKIRHEL